MMPHSPPSYKMLIWSIVAVAFYWLLSAFVSGLALQITFNSVVFGLSTSILLTWTPAAFYAMRHGAKGENQNIIAIFTIWMVVWLQRLYSIAFVSFDRPQWLMDSALPAFLAYLFGMAGVLFLLAPAFVKDVPRAFYLQLTISLVFGVIAAGAAFYLQLMGFDQ